MKLRKGDPRSRGPIKPRNPRKRLLNIIYFVDSKRTRTLQISIRNAALSIAVLAVMLVWSLVASGLLVNEFLVNNSLREHTSRLLTSIFSYQTRYDSVYERAYPQQGGVDSSAQSIVDLPPRSSSDTDEETSKQNDIKTRQASGDIPSTTSSISLAAKDMSETDRISKPENDAPQDQTRPDKHPPIAIENFSSSFSSDVLIVRFSLKNLEKKKKTTGTVNARAIFIDDNQKIRIVRMRIESDSSEANADNDSPSSDQHFNIRYYKNKVFHFDKPSDSKGIFTEVIVAIEDDLGRQKEFTYKLNISASTKVEESTKEASNTEQPAIEVKQKPFASVPDMTPQPQAQ